ncbi:DUF1275 family protein [Streptomyces microflavus]
MGQVFAGVMTGNLVLLGASAAGAGEGGVALRVVTALAAYACGAASGALMAGRLGLRLGVMLLAETVLLGAAAALWGLDLVASYGDRLGLLALVSLAMGVQGRIRVTPTNYFTGTLTSLAGRAAVRELEPADVWVLSRLGAVVAGAALAAVAERWWSPGAALGAVVLAVGALVLETAPRGGRRPGTGSPGRIGESSRGGLSAGMKGGRLSARSSMGLRLCDLPHVLLVRPGDTVPLTPTYR